MTTETSES